MCVKEKCAFTLAEFLAVLAITAILASASFAWAVRYQNSLKRLEMDQTAKEIFLTAQHQLALNCAEGVLERLLALDERPKEKLGILLNEEQGIYGVLYQVDEGQEMNEIRERLLPFGSIEETLRQNGSYLIVYEPENGIVREVWYSERYQFVEEDFGSEELVSAAVDAERREHFIGKNQKFAGGREVIGYYCSMEACQYENYR